MDSLLAWARSQQHAGSCASMRRKHSASVGQCSQRNKVVSARAEYYQRSPGALRGGDVSGSSTLCHCNAGHK
eukprot:6407275-Alexandrium_andersonii.AAC.1